MTVNYILALRLYIHEKLEKARGRVVSVHIRGVCRGDKRCEYVVAGMLAGLGAVRRQRGIYLIDRVALAELV